MLKLKPFWALEVPFFGQHIFFIIGHYIRKYYKLWSIYFTLGDALKNFFLFISSFSMSKQPEKPRRTWPFKHFVIFTQSKQPCDQFCWPVGFTFLLNDKGKLFFFSSLSKVYTTFPLWKALGVEMKQKESLLLHTHHYRKFRKKGTGEEIWLWLGGT